MTIPLPCLGTDPSFVCSAQPTNTQVDLAQCCAPSRRL